jgi:hypothetical protein
MQEPIRQAQYALEDEDFAVVRERDGSIVIVPRSLRNAGEAKRSAANALMKAACEYEAAGRLVEELVDEARDLRLSWDAIGWAVGTTGSAARKRWKRDDED